MKILNFELFITNCVCLFVFLSSMLKPTNLASSVESILWCLESSNSILRSTDYISTANIRRLTDLCTLIKRDARLECTQEHRHLSLRIAKGVLGIIALFLKHRQTNLKDDWQFTAGIASFALSLLEDFRSNPDIVKNVSDITQMAYNKLALIDAEVFLECSTVSADLFHALMDTLLAIEQPGLSAPSDNLNLDYGIHTNQDTDKLIQTNQDSDLTGINTDRGQEIGYRSSCESSSVLRLRVSTLLVHIMCLVKNTESVTECAVGPFDCYRDILSTCVYAEILQSLTAKLDSNSGMEQKESGEFLKFEFVVFGCT